MHDQTHVAAPGDSATLLGRLVRRHPLASLLLIFNTFGQALVFLPVVLERVNGMRLDLQVFQSLALVLFLLMPALLITRYVNGPQALQDLLRGGLHFGVPLRWYLIPFVLVPVGGVLSALSFDDGRSAIDLVSAYMTGFLPSLAIQFLSTNWWEELVWMGVIQVPLQRRYGALKSVLITTPLFALQHVVLFAERPLAAALVELGVLTVAIIFIRSFFAWQYNRTRSFALSGVIHASMNAAAFGFADVLEQPVQGGLVLAVLGLVLLIATRGRLGSEQGTNDGRSLVCSPQSLLRRPTSPLDVTVPTRTGEG